MASTRALEGLKVVDFSWVTVGPWTTKWLAMHGATVVKVESSVRHYPVRTARPFKDGVTAQNRSGYFINNNCGKYGMTLNLGHPKGPEVARQLIKWADIAVENFTVGTMGKWGLDYDHCRQINPGLVYLSLSSQGQTGPHARAHSYGFHLVALTGFSQITGWPDRDLAQPFGAYTDTIVPPLAVAAVLAAMDYKRRTGKGQYLDLSQYETTLHFLAPVVLDYLANGREAHREGNRCAYGAPHGVYACLGSDAWCAIAVFTDDEWQGFCQAIGNPPWTKEPRFSTLLQRKMVEDELDKLVSEWTARHTAEEVMTLMQQAGVPAGAVQTTRDVHEDPQLEHRQHFLEVTHPEIGAYRCDAPSYKLSKTPARAERAAPSLGEHTEYVCKELIGIPEEKFVELLLDGVFE